MNTRLILLLLVLIAIALGIYALSRNMPGDSAAPATMVATSTYENTEYGYVLDYPASLTVREYSLGNTVFGTISGEVIDGVVEARVVDITATPGQSLQEAAAIQLQALCAADSPNATFSCPRVDQAQTFVTRSGVSGYVLYLAGEMRSLPDGEVMQVGKGPFFVVPLSTTATGSRVLVVHPPLNQTAEDADAQTVRRVAESVRVRMETTRPAQPIEDFIRENINAISPIGPGMGGTFYVTSIAAENGSGTVSYEDGHMAYTADFSYTVSAGGVPSIAAFTVR